MPYLRSTGVALFITIAACGPGSVDEQLAEHKSKLGPRLQALERLLVTVDQQPPLERDFADELADGIWLEYPERNALLVHREELEEVSRRLKLPVRANNRSPWVDLAQALGFDASFHSELPTDERYDVGNRDPELMEKKIAQFLGTRYALVVRTRRFEPARMVGEKEFMPGTYEGEVLIYAMMDNPKLIGGFRFEAHNARSVQTRLGRDRQNLDANLDMQVQGTIRDRLKKLVPGIAEQNHPGFN